jgi:TonB family protein
VRSSVIGSGIVHLAILLALFAVRTVRPLVVPGPEVVQVSLLEPTATPATPVAAPPVETPPQTETVQPTEDTGVKVTPDPPKKPPKPKKEEPEQAPAQALPYASVGNAGLQGAVAVDAADFEFTYYLVLIRNRIATNWAPPAGLSSGGQPMRAVVFFRIARDGTVSDTRIESASPVDFFDRSALRAVQLSDPMPPLPLGYTRGDLGVHFGFEYVAP